MRKHLLGLMLVAAITGCSSESDVALPGKAGEVAGANGAAPPTATSLAANRGSTTAFASLPDRGELLAYGGARKVRTEGAYTWHPVSLSEDHALNSIGTGRMVVSTPGGKPLNLEYERHEEQPDGNWSWIGRSADGATAVLTFGEKAVFGTITRGDEHYRVRTDRSGAWLVATDPRLVAANGGRPKNGTDVLMPPESRALASAASRHLATKATSQDIAQKSTAVVDVLLGYSSTIANEVGSQAGAVTLVTNLAAAANAAYANSGVNMRLRVVHAMSVNYADATRNRDALQQLTGYNVDTQQPVTPNSAFTALRAARNEYGADLVAIVRRYREPEQDGCGIAWLLGMNETGISADDEAFGYAVVSDGTDRDESDSNTYFCSQLSLAHELGHLMGQAHDQDNAEDAGVHSYSYGYRESSPTGFFTIMAYPSGTSQIEAPHFANPAVRFSGRPTGTATEDNVRSMNQTMPIVSLFRATVVPLQRLKNDFDGDGKADIYWNDGNGRSTIWRSANASTAQAVASIGNSTWQVAGIGDFNADGKSDVLWHRSLSGESVIWLSANSSTRQTVATLSKPGQLQVAGVGDFNGDGRADILWHRESNGTSSIWLSGNANTSVAVTTISLPGKLKIAGIGDFNGDGRDDILWHRSSNGTSVIWLSANSASPQQVATLRTPNQLQVAGIGDFDGDGRDDILWHRASNGTSVIWRSGDANTSLPVTTVGLAGELLVASVADFNGDGRTDILWHRAANRTSAIWLSANSNTSQAVATMPQSGWRIIP